MPSMGRTKPDKMLEVPESLRDYLRETSQDWVISRSRPMNEKLAYLAGIIDGEGCFSISRKHDKRRSGPQKPPEEQGRGWFRERSGRDYAYHASVFIVNTNADMMRYVCDILDDIEIPFHLMRRKTSDKRQREFYQLSIGRQMHIKKLIETLLPWLVAKRSEALLMLRFVSKRMERNATTYKTFNQYDDEEHDLLDGMKALKWVESSEAIRQALDPRVTLRIEGK